MNKKVIEKENIYMHMFYSRKEYEIFLHHVIKKFNKLFKF